MAKSNLRPLLRIPLRLIITGLALVIGLLHGPTLSGGGDGSIGFPITSTTVFAQCDGGGGGDGGDYCQYTYDCTCFCPTNCDGYDPCGGDGGDCGNGYYGWGDGCGDGGGPY